MELIKYIIEEAKVGRLLPADALDLLMQLGRKTPVPPAVMLHPLLQLNTSRLSEQRFSSVFSGDEFFLCDHVVRGSRVLPGVCYLEMARAGLVASLDGDPSGAFVVEFKDVVWLQPVVVMDSQEVHLGLTSDNKGEIEFEIYTGKAGANEAEVIHAQGRAVLVDAALAEAAKPIDLSLLRSQCDQSIDVAQCYAAFSAMGIEYGAAHRGLVDLQVGTDKDGQRFALAQVGLPTCVSGTAEQYGLHPSVLDSALQASMGLSLATGTLLSEGVTKAALPFALERLRILDRSPALAIAVVRPCKTSGSSAILSDIQKLDIDLCDESGRVCVSLQGFTSRVLEAELSHRRCVVQEEHTLLLTPSWEATPLVADALTNSVEYGEWWVFVDAVYKESLPELAAQYPAIKWSLLPSLSDGTTVDHLLAASEQVFTCVQSILHSRAKDSVLVQVLLGAEVEYTSATSALSGFLKSAAQENPRISGQVLMLSHTATVAELVCAAEENARAAAKRDVEIRYVDGVRQVIRFKELSKPVAATYSLPWKDGGVYLITGGGGELGLIMAREIVARVNRATIILTGRSPISEATQTKIHAFKDLANEARIEYRVLDVCDAAAVTRCVHALVEQYGSLNGIVHSAGVTKDNFIIKKTLEEFRSVLAPKVSGTVNLDEATQAIELDCFIMFSSVASVMGNVGQCDYALANAFMDRYAIQRHLLVEKNQRHGKTLSINWPLWADGGMQLDAAALEQMHRQGMTSLATTAGIGALYRAWLSHSPQVVVLAGNRQQFGQPLGVVPQLGMEVLSEPAVTSVAQTKTIADVSKDELQAKTHRYLKKLLSGALKMPADRIESDVGLEQYGIDSILALQLVNELEMSFGLLPKTLLFEYQSIAALAGYLIEHHRGALVTQLKLTQRTSMASPALPSLAATSAEAANLGNKRRRGRSSHSPLRDKGADKDQAGDAFDVAIIGISGRYPGANDVNEYWENLQAGKDCISEIPAERWDYREYFDPEKGKFGKSYTKWGGFIEGVDQFDPLFFNISPREAIGMDPQERLFLQCVYQTVEDAGYTREALQNHRAMGLGGNVGVFVGVMYEEYQLYGAQAQILGQPYALGGNPSSIANRVSYFCNFHGPSMAVDTMCSSSLTAIHLACQSIRCGGCEVAIAGGVNVSIHPNKYLGLSQGQFASSTGRCESFGKGGDGYVPGEGVGAALLKPLRKAVADRDHIYAVIKGTSINHGGKTNGYTVPNPVAQAAVIARALQEAKIDARTISYIEAHGTGTSLGDPIEIAGLTRAFEQHTQDKQYCAIGSAKSNIGHLESAAGIAALTKVVLQMQHRILVPSLHSRTLNPYIDFTRTPFKVQQSMEAWHRPCIEIDGAQKECLRIAGISSFGAGGANAHVIIEEYVEPAEEHHTVEITSENPALIVLSAQTEERLYVQVRQLIAYLNARSCTHADLANIAYTLQVGREPLEHRLAFTAISIDELCAKLSSYVEGGALKVGMEECCLGAVKGNKDMLSIFNTDPALQLATTTWVEQGQYGRLLELWVKGLTVEWSQFYVRSKPQRISLPTYPFVRERYWIESASPGIPTAPNEHSVRSECLLSKVWQASAVALQESALPSVAILCTSETQGLAEQLAQRFASSHVLRIDGDSTELPSEIDWQAYTGWIDVVGCGVGREHTVVWTACLRQWIERGPKEGLLALCVTRGLEAHANTTINLAGADRVGLYRMLSSEYSRITSRHVDIDPVVDEQAAIEQILVECSSPREEIEVCYRNGTRYCGALHEIAIAPNDGVVASQAQILSSFPSEHVLWISGGTRGVGYACAQHFVRQHGVKKLVLTGQDEFPPRDEWHKALSEQTPVAKKIRAVLALEAEGAEVQVLSVSLTDAEALRESVRTIKAAWGSIGGVIHCAGTTDIENPAFVRKTVASMQSVLAPKVSGLDNMVNCLAEEPLRFFLLFSSVSAVVPSLAVGNSDYAMANAYMDYVAQAYAATLPIQSIQWPNWKETGMGEVSTPLYRQMGFLSHTTAEGLHLLDRVLASKLDAVVLPAIIDAARWQPARLMRYNAREVVRSSSVIASNRIGGAHLPDASLSAVQAWLVSLVADTLQMAASSIEIDKPLPDYGADSILLVQILRPVGERVGEPIDPSILFEYPTIEGLSRWLMNVYGAKLQQEPAANTGAANAKARSHDDPSIAVVSKRSPQRTQRSNSAHRLQMLMKHSNAGATDIAVVGLACRFPGANNIEEYWRLLSDGRSAIRRVPPERWGHDSHYYAGVLDNATQFDPAFFLIPSTDARAMDPQALMVLEESLMLWHQAGYTQDEIKGRAIGVYLGARSQHLPDEANLTAAHNPVMAIGANYLAANVSRFFDLRGPSVVIDTACSSALVAMNMAMQSIGSGDIESALVGGVSLLTNDGALRLFEQRGILNRQGAFHLFDRRASGALLGEGAGMVWLKSVDQALQDGDSIYAVIKALAINNDGRTAGPAAPNLQAQKEVMQSALAKSGKQPEEIDYIDVNGSGTEVTDLLELKAIEAVYRSSSKTPCELGSMKPNIGHPLCAEGIASFIKSVLMLHHRQRVPFLSAQEPMRHYDLSASPFRFTRSIDRTESPLSVVAINCFADGGTNAHVILEAWRDEESRPIVRLSIPPPTLRKIECRPVTPRLSRDSVVLSKQSHCTASSHTGTEQATEASNLDFWEKYIGVDVGNHAITKDAEVAE